jgi:transcriptional regulator with XRE-family HTH domain
MATGSSQRFGDLLRRHRLAAGLTQEELAAQAGLSVRGLSDLERGARLAPRRETVELLAEALLTTAQEWRAAALLAVGWLEEAYRVLTEEVIPAGEAIRKL